MSRISHSFPCGLVDGIFHYEEDPSKILDFIIYWSIDKIQLLYFLYQVMQLTLATVSVTDKVTEGTYFWLYDQLHR